MRSIIVAALLAGCGQAIAVQAATIDVAAGPNAQEAVQTALIDAKPGDTVRLGAGRFAFAEGLSLDVANVTVAGMGRDKTFLSFAGQKTAAEGLMITSNRVLVRDLTIEDARGDGIKAKGVDRFTVRDLAVVWTGGPKASNGGYGVYPVASSNVLIERVTVRGASDAGIYVGQSKNIVVRNNVAEFNVAGIEIENSVAADVHDNLVTRNAGGILVFDLPNLPQMGGHSTRIFANRIVDNMTPNFAAPGNTVAEVPTGTGVMVMANRNVHVFGNVIDGNGTAAVMIVGYKKPFQSAGYNPLPRDITVRGNTIGRNGFAPAFPGGAALAQAVGGQLPPVFWDGAARYAGGAEPVRIMTDAPMLSLNLVSTTADLASARPALTAGVATAPSPEPAAVVLPADQP